MNLTKLLIAAPTAIEMRALDSALKGRECKRVICGVGPAHAAFGLTAAIFEEQPDLVVLAGICGLFKDSGNDLGTLIMASSETFGDLGRCTGYDVEPIEIGGKALEIHFDLEPHLAALSLDALMEQLEIVTGPMVTVSCTSASEGRRLLGDEAQGFLGENMEGAAAAMVCSRLGLPFLELRGASNFVGDQNKAKWRTNLALERVSAAIAPLLEHIGMI